MLYFYTVLGSKELQDHHLTVGSVEDEATRNLEITTFETQIMIDNFTEQIETVAVDPFMDKVETYVIFTIAMGFRMYWFPVLVPIGLIGNTLSFLVMIKPNNRKMSTCIYMAAISINNNLMMCLAIYTWVFTVAKEHSWHPIECKLKVYLVAFALQNSTYQVLVMTIDKYVAIKWPHRAAIYSTPRRAKFTILVILIWVMTYSTPHLFFSGIIGKECFGYLIGGIITKVYSWLTLVVNALIPFSMLMYMNYLNIKKVRQSRKMLSTNDTQNDSQGQGNANKKRQKTMKNTENQLTVMLLLVTTLFLILMIPTYMRFLYTTFVDRDTPEKYARLIFFYHISQKLYHSNNGINFSLYCISGQKFRSDLKELLCCSNDSLNNREAKLQSSLTEASYI